MTPGIRHLTMEELEAGLEQIRNAPKDSGVLELIVRRPQTDTREVLEVVQSGVIRVGEIATKVSTSTI